MARDEKNDGAGTFKLLFNPRVPRIARHDRQVIESVNLAIWLVIALVRR
jgi:hypothetical protein